MRKIGEITDFTVVSFNSAAICGGVFTLRAGKWRLTRSAVKKLAGAKDETALWRELWRELHGGRDLFVMTGAVPDGVFFTFGYKDWSGAKLVNKLIYYGVSAIALESTGAQREGMRGCASTIREDQYELLDERLRKFNEDFSQYDPYDPNELPEIR